MLREHGRLGARADIGGSMNARDEAAVDELVSRLTEKCREKVVAAVGIERERCASRVEFHANLCSDTSLALVLHRVAKEIREGV